MRGDSRQSGRGTRRNSFSNRRRIAVNFLIWSHFVASSRTLGKCDPDAQLAYDAVPTMVAGDGRLMAGCFS
jgi:hypothetical protein